MAVCVAGPAHSRGGHLGQGRVALPWHRVKRIFREEWWREETEIEACSQKAWKNAKVKAEERKAKGSAPACEICTHAA